MPDEVLRIANCSGFYGDRLSAAREQVDGGPIDVLCGDWLAELTMLILARASGGGWARTFLAQLEDVLGDCLERGIRIVSNAGGLDPTGCAAAVQELASGLGLAPKIASITGDDLLGRLDEFDLTNVDTGEPLADRAGRVLTANAYVGGWGIADALRRDADIVITGRVTDAALVVGPSAWRFGWARDDWDVLAGAVVAGHVIECGPQATGGNYSFFQEVGDLARAGYPIAEMRNDGSSVITKHHETGGAVTVGTVTAQLLYEIGSPSYANPDVTARFDTIRLTQEGPDRVLIDGVRGEPPPPTLKAGLNYVGGYRNSVTFMITGIDAEAKAGLAQEMLWSALDRNAFESVDVEFERGTSIDPADNTDAIARLRVTISDGDEKKVGRAFSRVATEMYLSGYPGFFTADPPKDAAPFGVFWPAKVPASAVTQRVAIGEDVVEVPSTVAEGVPMMIEPPVPSQCAFDGERVDAPIGAIVGARSGDKGGNANLGVWARTPDAYGWLESFLTVERLQELLPEARSLEVERHVLPNIAAMNFVIHGLLGRGVAASTRIDPQAKGFAEYFRSKVVPVPAELVERLSPA